MSEWWGRGGIFIYIYDLSVGGVVKWIFPFVFVDVAVFGGAGRGWGVGRWGSNRCVRIYDEVCAAAY